MSEAALATVQRELERDTEILKLIAELRNVFESHFDRTWFSLIIDGMPIDFRTVRDIREMVSNARRAFSGSCGSFCDIPLKSEICVMRAPKSS